MSLKEHPPNVNKPSRFKIAAPMDPAAFSGPSRGRQSIPKLKFSLLDTMKSSTHSASEYNKEIKLDLRPWLKNEIDRQIIGTVFHPQDVIVACCEKALLRFMCYDRYYHFWDLLSKALRCKEQEFPSGSTDFAEINELCDDFIVPIQDVSDYNGSHSKRRTFRFPVPLFDQMNAVAETIGMHVSNLIQLLVIDGLRAQSETIQRDLMETIIEDFYFQFIRRLRKMYAGVVHVWDLTFSDKVAEIIHEIEAWGELG